MYTVKYLDNGAKKIIAIYKLLRLTEIMNINCYIKLIKQNTQAFQSTRCYTYLTM